MGGAEEGIMAVEVYSVWFKFQMEEAEPPCLLHRRSDVQGGLPFPSCLLAVYPLLLLSLLRMPTLTNSFPFPSFVLHLLHCRL
ncbi:hypothetical protein V6N13_093863 [Hibiscus sabdariffa]|uniref:Uncharacterized protein n=1 Tax=Hibiscus sabdariffa TaxID=183260 RepID=A0ABR2NKU2_9ROSI